MNDNRGHRLPDYKAERIKKLIGEGLTHKIISERLGISEVTINRVVNEERQKALTEK